MVEPIAENIAADRARVFLVDESIKKLTNRIMQLEQIVLERDNKQQFAVFAKIDLKIRDLDVDRTREEEKLRMRVNAFEREVKNMVVHIDSFNGKQANFEKQINQDNELRISHHKAASKWQQDFLNRYQDNCIEVNKEFERQRSRIANIDKTRSEAKLEIEQLQTGEHKLNRLIELHSS